MLADPKAKRFSEQFTRQWLGMQLLDFLNVDKKFFNQFDIDLRKSMKEEPVALFHKVLQENGSVMDFLHADYTMLIERLATHYGIADVYGNEFRKVSLERNSRRGGLLTQAGPLAMNSDGKDSHPLKRGIWLLENILHDPPPPPPPAVPEIDLTDPIAQGKVLTGSILSWALSESIAIFGLAIGMMGARFPNLQRLFSVQFRRDDLSRPGLCSAQTRSMISLINPSLVWALV